MFKKTILILMGAIMAYCIISILFLLIKENIREYRESAACDGKIVLMCGENTGCVPTCMK